MFNDKENSYVFKDIKYFLTQSGIDKLDELVDIEIDRIFQNSSSNGFEVGYEDIFENFLNNYKSVEFIKEELKCL